MSRSFIKAAVLALFVFCVGCGLGPNPKLGSYVNVSAQPPVSSFLEGYSADHRLPVGLLVINDTSDKESPPSMTPESITALTEQLSHQIERQFPFQVVHVLKNPPVQSGNLESLSQLGKEAGVEYFVVAVLSSQEVESPERLPLGGANQGGGGRGWLVGYETQNFSLAEIAIVDVKNGQSLFHSSGQGYATLDRLMVPLESNVYPVVHGAQRQPPIFPDHQFQYDVLRSVSAHQAIDQAMLHLKQPGNPRAES